MATIKDVYQINTSASLGGLNSAIGAVKTHSSGILTMAKSAAGAAAGGVKALTGGIKSLASISLGGIASGIKGISSAINDIKSGGLGAVKKGLEGIKGAAGGALSFLSSVPEQIFFLKDLFMSLKDAAVGFITSAAAASPELGKELGELSADFAKVQNQLLGAFGKALAPAIHAIGLALEDPRFQAFIDMLTGYLIKGVSWLADVITKDVVPAFMNFMPKVEPLIKVFQTFFQSLQAGQDPLDAIIETVVRIASVLGMSKKDLTGFNSSLWKMRDVVGQVQSFISDKALPLIRGAIKLVADWWKKHSKEITDALKSMWSALLPIFTALFKELEKIWKDVGPKLIKAVQDIYKEVIPTVKAIVTWIKDHSEDIIAIIKAACKIIGDVIKILIDAVQTIIRVGMAVLRGDWSGAWNLIKDFIKNLGESLKDIISNFLEAILRLVGTNTEDFVKTWRTNWEMFITIVKTVVGNIISSVSTFFGDLSSSFISKLASIITTWRDRWDALVDIVSGVWDDVSDFVSGGIDNIRGFLTGLRSILETPWQGLVSFVTGIWNGIRNVVVGGINGIIDAINSLIGAYNTIAVTLGLPIMPYLGHIAGAAAAMMQKATSSSVMSGVAPQMAGQSASKGGQTSSSFAAQASSAAQFVIQIFGPFGSGYTPEDAGVRAANSFVVQARAQGVRV